MKKIIRLIALLALAIITAALLWKFVPWATLPTKYAAFSISDLSPVWYYSTVIVVALLLMVVIWFVLQIVPKRQAQALQKPEKKILADKLGVNEDGSLYTLQSSLKPSELFTIENEARKTLSQIIGGFIVIVSLILTGANLAITQRETEKNRSLALEGQITERFTKAIGQLDRKNGMEVRLGGIYALERIAKDSEKDHWTIIEVLSAYVRENARRKDEKPTQKNASRKNQGKAESPTPKLPTDIQAILTVIGRRKADGEPSQIDLRNTDLSGANLIGADLREANLRGAILEGAYLIGANLSEANLSEANLREADLSEAILIGAILSGADLSRANLSVAILSGADLSGADLSGADLSEAILRGAILSVADLRGANLSVADLSVADLSGAKLSEATLSWANLSGANLSGASLREAQNLTWEQISQAIIDDKTKLPSEIEDQHKDELKAMREKTRKERER